MTASGAVRRGGKGIGRDGLRIPDRIVTLFTAAAASDRRASLFIVLFCLIAFIPGFFSLPVIDPDEARMAQTTRQILQTGDVTDLRLGSEGRHTRPFGLYWVQSGVVGLADLVGIPHATQTIAIYRLPSLAAGIGVALLTFWAALVFVARPAALFAALLMASSAALGVLARLATPEVMTVAAVTGAMGAAARLYLLSVRLGSGEALSDAEARHARIAFWGAIAAGLFFRGVLPVLFVMLALLALGFADRRWAALRRLVWWPGIGLALFLLGVGLYLRFFLSADPAFGRDQVGRMAEAFGGLATPPGAYLLMFWPMFWPGAPLVALAAPILWKARRLRAVRFLLAFVLPAWIVLELLPHKYPANIVATFPAIAILVALAVERGAMALRNMRLARLLWLWPVIGALIAIGALLALALLDRTTSFAAWPLLLMGFFALFTAAASVRDYGVVKASLLGIAGMVVAGFGVMQLILPNLESLWVSPRLAEVAQAESCAATQPLQLGSAGYNEPSLAFLAPGEVRFLDGAGAAEFLAEGGCRAVFVERRQEARFVRRAEGLRLRIQRGADVRGFDYNEARRVRMSLYRRG